MGLNNSKNSDSAINEKIKDDTSNNGVKDSEVSVEKTIENVDIKVKQQMAEIEDEYITVELVKKPVCLKTNNTVSDGYVWVCKDVQICGENSKEKFYGPVPMESDSSILKAEFNRKSLCLKCTNSKTNEVVTYSAILPLSQQNDGTLCAILPKPKF